MICGVLPTIRYGVVANIIASHAIARGSIPRVGISFATQRKLRLFCRLANVVAKIEVFFFPCNTLRPTFKKNCAVVDHPIQVAMSSPHKLNVKLRGIKSIKRSFRSLDPSNTAVSYGHSRRPHPHACPPSSLATLRHGIGGIFLTRRTYMCARYGNRLVRLFLLVDGETAGAHVHEEDQAADNR